MQKINYVSQSERNALLATCNNERDKLILKLGFEAGLCPGENIGLVLGKHEVGSKKHSGILEIFNELDRTPEKQHFAFVLDGKYTKNANPRYIYFNRELLREMKRYHDNERAIAMRISGLSCETLFVRHATNGIGLPINKEHASNIVLAAKKINRDISRTITYYDLRHTFATDLYHNLVVNHNGTRDMPKEEALHIVSHCLGLRNIKSAIRYTRTEQEMLTITGIEKLFADILDDVRTSC